MIKLHHLNRSRSKRIIWLLEELEVEYEIISYQRDAQTNLAPPELKKIHPLGKSPVIEDGEQVLAESGAIVEYLVNQYGAERLAPPAGSAEYNLYLQWLHFAEGSAILPMLLGYFLQLDGCDTRFLGDYAKAELAKILSYMNTEVSAQPYLVGEQFTGADILNSFVLERVDSRNGLAAYPELRAYLTRINARPASIKAAELEARYDKNV